jgi:hypothetical protein
VTGTTNITTNSTTYVLMEDMFIAMTTKGGDVVVRFTTSISHSTAPEASDCALFVDGFEVFSIRLEAAGANLAQPVSLDYLVTGLGAGSHVFEIKWRPANASNTVRQRPVGWGAGRHLYLMEYP